MNATSLLKRHFLDEHQQEEAVSLLERCLVDFLHAELQCKQAHWNVMGKRFYSMHLQLEGIAKAIRKAADKVAGRIVALDACADGRPATLVWDSSLEPFPLGRFQVEQVVSLIADRLAVVIAACRKSIAGLQDLDCVSQNMLQDICQRLEQHLWMIQAQEEEPAEGHAAQNADEAPDRV